MGPAEFIDELAAQFQGKDDILSSLKGNYEKKLWHQLTADLEALVEDPDFQQGDVLLQIYDNFISGVALRLNPLRFAQIAVRTAGSFANAPQALEFLEKVRIRLFHGCSYYSMFDIRA